jgi:hypothetical protein
MIHNLLPGVLGIPLCKTLLYYTHAQKNRMYPTFTFKIILYHSHTEPNSQLKGKMHSKKDPRSSSIATISKSLPAVANSIQVC